jgi:hypothetical protein
MCPTMDLGVGLALGTDRWRSQATKTAKTAKNTAAIISNYANHQLTLLSFAKNLWTLDRTLRTFLTQFYEDLETGKFKGITPTEAQIREGILALRNISEPVEKMYARAKAAGLTNRVFVGAALNSVFVRAEDILDIAEAVELSLEPHLDGIFDRALGELERGEALDLASFR